MTQRENIAAFLRGRILVTLHDQEGFPFELSLKMFKDRDEHVSLFGIILEIAHRKMSSKLLREMIKEWAMIFQPSCPEEQQILDIYV